MASNFNVKKISWDGKAKVILGDDDNSKIIEGSGEEFIIKNADGSDAKIAKENIPFMPEDASEENKLLTENDKTKLRRFI